MLGISLVVFYGFLMLGLLALCAEADHGND